ncbi:hypothetical protein [Rhodopila sp.]|uniref:glycine-rich domain-containing protein n=1 Tax=Rhodopila sp. TaxID=2480087 RepID=UPI003D147680
MQLIQNGTQGGASVPAKQAAVGTPGYANSGSPGTFSPTTADPDVFNTVLAEIAAVIIASGQTLNAANNAQLLQAIQAVPSGRLLNVQVFKTPGTFTYTPTAGTNSVDVEVQAGGGGGAGAPGTGSGQYAHAGGGSAGSYARKRITSGFAGVTITVGVGGGGFSGTYGGPGGSSSFGSIVSAAGGIGGNIYGPISSSTFVVGNTAAAATPTSGDINVTGPTPSQSFTISGNGITPAPAASMFGFSYGAGGASGGPIGPSSFSTVGLAGPSGIVIVREYA